jgi:DNA mismatch repair protein MutS
MDDYTPMIRQYLEIKEQNKDALLFYRLGDFYEMFFEDAEKASKLLDLVLTGRDCGKEERAPMCGVPYHSAEAYINRLISMGIKVAVCEQVEDPSQAKGIVKREVVRRITPGTTVDGQLLDEGKNNYIAAIYGEKDAVGLCFADVSAGVLKATSLRGADAPAKVLDELAAYHPKEVLVCEGFPMGKAFSDFVSEQGIFVQQVSALSREEAAEKLARQTNRTREALTEDPEIVHAAGVLLSYLDDTVMCDLQHMTNLELYSQNRYVEMSVQARRCLELTETMMHQNRKGSLLHVLDCTKSAMGARMLRSFVEKPLYSLAAVQRRQNAVAELYADAITRGELRAALSQVYDLERLMGQIMYGTANARVLTGLSKTAALVPGIKSLLEGKRSEELNAIREDLADLEPIARLIDAAIVDAPPFSVREGGMIRQGFDEELDKLTYIAQNGKALLAEMEAREREATGIKNLKIGYNRVFGYYIELSKSNTANAPAHYTRKQTLANAERYITPELKELETSILQAQEGIKELEYTIFCRIRDTVKAESGKIMKTAAALARLDAFCALAETAAARNYCRPEIDLSGIIEIHEGRHPVVEALQKDTVFVPNDTLLDTGENRMAVITGPNMAGKSTYMRQVALIVLMAQMGSFVPAKSARIGLVDKIFTRIGAADELSAGRSTFMVEMSEMADILKQATSQSLLVLDEIGRGTSTYDGMAIARAVLEYAASKKTLGAKTLFATHYHELTVLEQELDGVKNYNITTKKRGGDLVFLRKIVRGGADDSYGIEVAKLAGLPKPVVDRAKVLLAELESKNPKTPAMPVAVSVSDQESLTAGQSNALLEELALLSVETMTPLEAMNKLFALSKQAKELL